jgi:hypothetical protein
MLTNYYGIIATNIFLAYLLAKLTFAVSHKIKLIIITAILVLFNAINLESNITISAAIFGFIGYVSIPTICICMIYIINTIFNKKSTPQIATSLAFILIMTILYSMFFVSSYTIYDIGFTPYIIIGAFAIYGICLSMISDKFAYFNYIVLFAIAFSFTNILGNNVWNYLIDPTLLIVCVIEILSTININKKAETSS